MKALKNMRTESGLTQHELAGLLGVSRSHLSVVEVSDRGLNSAALMSLRQINSLIKKTDIEIDSLYSTCDIISITDEYKIHLNKCVWKRLILELRLQKMEDDFAKARAVFIVYSHQKENYKDAVPLSIESKLKKASAKILASGKFHQELLSAQIRQLTAEEAGWSGCLEKLSKIQSPMIT